MKKYLMTGIAAVAMCAAFTSCSHDVEPVSQEDLNKFEAQKIVENYNQAFIRTFGQPAANQTWGFGTTRGVTRAHADGAIDVNGNEWLPEDVPAVEDPAEVNAIYDYAHHTPAELDALQLPYSTTAPQNLNGYYVTQVRHGKNADNVYDAFDGTHLENCGEKMNFLQIKFDQNAGFPVNQGQNQGWEHINNFNASFSSDHGAMTSKDFGNTRVVEKGAFDFAYYNSVDSKFHNNWILVDGYYITEDHRFQNFYYVCFDFEGTPNCVSKIRFRIKGGDEYNTTLDGAWTAEQAVKQNLEVTLWNGTKVKLGEDIETNFKAGTPGVYQGLQVESVDNGDKKFDPDERHTDWIIRITKGPRVDPDDVCIIAEDLSANEATDFDFNDVVFTVHYKTETTADITLYAAGGTLPLKVAGHEVHAEFGYADPDPTTGLYKMINTGAMANVNNVNTVSFEVSGINKSNRGNDIVILVNKGKKNEAGEFVDNWIELKANAGEPAAKLCVGVDYATDAKWCDERENISGKYPPFTQWVTSDPTIIWWK